MDSFSRSRLPEYDEQNERGDIRIEMWNIKDNMRNIMILGLKRESQSFCDDCITS